MWETRKRIQQQRMEEETRILQKEQKEREKSITNREKVFNEQTARLQGNKITNGNVHSICLYIHVVYKAILATPIGCIQVFART